MTTDDAKAVLHRGHAAHAPRGRILGAEEAGRGASRSVLGRVGYSGKIDGAVRGTDHIVCGSAAIRDA